MPPGSTATHASNLLNVADPDAAVLDMMSSALRSASRDRASWRTLDRLDQWTTEQRKLLKVSADQALNDDKVLDLLAAVHLVATRVPARFRRRSAIRFHFRIAALGDRACGERVGL
jgi:hypothetical protein